MMNKVIKQQKENFFALQVFLLEQDMCGFNQLHTNCETFKIAKGPYIEPNSTQ